MGQLFPCEAEPEGQAQCFGYLKCDWTNLCGLPSHHRWIHPKFMCFLVSILVFNNTFIILVFYKHFYITYFTYFKIKYIQSVKNHPVYYLDCWSSIRISNRKLYKWKTSKFFGVIFVSFWIKMSFKIICVIVKFLSCVLAQKFQPVRVLIKKKQFNSSIFLSPMQTAWVISQTHGMTNSVHCDADGSDCNFDFFLKEWLLFHQVKNC